MAWQLAEAPSVCSFEFPSQTASLVPASCLPMNVPENIYFKICGRRAKLPELRLCETPSLFLPFVNLPCPGLISKAF